MKLDLRKVRIYVCYSMFLLE